MVTDERITRFENAIRTTGYGSAIESTKAEYKAALDALEAALAPVQAEGWKTMESAPKSEDNYILVYRDGFYDVVNFGWTDIDGGDWWYNGDVGIQPTHWIALPAPPATSKGEAE